MLEGRRHREWTMPRNGNTPTSTAAKPQMQRNKKYISNKAAYLNFTYSGGKQGGDGGFNNPDYFI